MCFPLGRKTLITAEGSSENSITFSISGAPNCCQKKLELHGGESKHVPINHLDAGPLISSIVEVLIRDRSGKILHTYTFLPRFLAPYKQVRIAVDSPFTVEFVSAPPGFWLNFIRFFSSFRFGNKNVSRRRRPNWPVDIESQAAPNLSERMSKDSSVLNSPIHNVCQQKDEDIDNKSEVSDGHCVDIASDDSYNTESSIGSSTETSSFRSCTSPTDSITPHEENVGELEAESSSFVGSILDFSKRFIEVITI